MEWQSQLWKLPYPYSPLPAIRSQRRRWWQRAPAYIHSGWLPLGHLLPATNMRLPMQSPSVSALHCINLWSKWHQYPLKILPISTSSQRTLNILPILALSRWQIQWRLGISTSSQHFPHLNNFSTSLPSQHVLNICPISKIAIWQEIDGELWWVDQVLILWWGTCR